MIKSWESKYQRAFARQRAFTDGAKNLTPIKKLKFSVRISFAADVDIIVTLVSVNYYHNTRYTDGHFFHPSSETHFQIASLIEAISITMTVNLLALHRDKCTG